MKVVDKVAVAYSARIVKKPEDRVTKRQAAFILRKAAGLLDGPRMKLNKGWFEAHNAYCIIGTVRKVDRPGWFGLRSDKILFALANQAKSEGLLPVVTSAATSLSLATWNDAPYTTKADVQGLLRRTARALEHGSKL